MEPDTLIGIEEGEKYYLKHYRVRPKSDEILAITTLYDKCQNEIVKKYATKLIFKKVSFVS